MFTDLLGTDMLVCLDMSKSVSALFCGVQCWTHVLYVSFWSAIHLSML